jgi:ubiquinol-cytochrome c reductase iron-sulfur subunit
LAGAALAAWPFIDSMEPAADTRAAGAPVDVDLSSLQPGQQIMLKWRGRPIFVVRRTPEALRSLKDPELISQLRDPRSQENQQPEYAANWHRSIKPEYLVLVGNCTHLGCIPDYKPNRDSLKPGWLGGYFCPCHGSLYDIAGRVFKGVPAPYNLPVPPYHFATETSVGVGENPPNTKWSFESIEQV